MGTEPRTVKMIAESLFLRLSETRVMRPKRTNWAAISAASSLPTTLVKSQSHSRAASAMKQCLWCTEGLPAARSDDSWSWIPFERS